MEKIKFPLKILFSIPRRRIISTNYYSKEGVKKEKKNDKPIISSCHYITTCHIKCWIYNLRSAGLLATVKLLRARERLIGRVHSSIHSHLESLLEMLAGLEKNYWKSFSTIVEDWTSSDKYTISFMAHLTFSYIFINSRYLTIQYLFCVNFQRNFIFNTDPFIKKQRTRLLSY